MQGDAQQPAAMTDERAAFEAWASGKGYDTAHTYDTERSRWVWLNPMTADLWQCWQARALLAAQAQPQVPDGWQLVPKEPTNAMLEAALTAFQVASRGLASTITKADARALWHAVDALAWQVRAMPSIEPPLAPEDIAAERVRLTAARRALRKVNSIRKGEHD